MANWIPAYLKAMQPYLDNPNVSGMYGMWNAPDPADVNGPNGPGVPGEGGVDLGSPQGTPVLALADGQIIGVGYWKDQGHGVVTTRIDVPGFGANDIYYQHIIFDPKLKQGDTVKRGQQIGTIGQYNEVEIGFNANWGQPWGTNHPAGWVKDPRPLIKALMAEGDPGTVAGSNTVNITLKEYVDSVLTQLRNNAGVTNVFGATYSKNIENFMIAWCHAEGGSQTNSCSFNVLNTMQDEQGATQCQGALPGIKSYPDSATGEKATIDALQNGNYGALLHALTTNDENNLGFHGLQMANNIAADLSVWVSGKRSPLQTSYIYNIMADAGINQASINGAQVDSIKPAASQSTIDGWGATVIGQGTVPDNNPLDAIGAAFSNVNNFFGALTSFFSNPVRLIKIIGGGALVITGLVLLIRSLAANGGK